MGINLLHMHQNICWGIEQKLIYGLSEPIEHSTLNYIMEPE